MEKPSPTVRVAYAPTIFLRAFLLFQVQPLGKTEKALQYIHLDARSEFASNLLPGVYLREGKIADAKSASQRMSKNPAWYGSLLQACLERSDIAAARRANQTALMAERDPEMKYYQASLLAFCGQGAMAMRLLRSAIEQNYCASSALQADPLWAKVRDNPEFAELQSLATRCQERFLAALTAPEH